MTVATEAVQPGDEIQVAERSPPVQLEIQTSEQSTDSIPTHVAIIPSATAVPIGATESASKEPSKEELARIIESILEEGMQFGDVSQIAKHTIQSESEQTNEPAEARRRPVDGTAERNAPELVNPEPITANSDAATGMSVASINGAEKTWSGENLATGAGRLTEIVEQSSPAQTVPNEQTGLSKQGEGEFLNTFSRPEFRCTCQRSFANASAAFARSRQGAQRNGRVRAGSSRTRDSHRRRRANGTCFADECDTRNYRTQGSLIAY